MTQVRERSGLKNMAAALLATAVHTERCVGSASR